MEMKKNRAIFFLHIIFSFTEVRPNELWGFNETTKPIARILVCLEKMRLGKIRYFNKINDLT